MQDDGQIHGKMDGRTDIPEALTSSKMDGQTQDWKESAGQGASEQTAAPGDGQKGGQCASVLPQAAPGSCRSGG